MQKPLPNHGFAHLDLVHEAMAYVPLSLARDQRVQRQDQYAKLASAARAKKAPEKSPSPHG